VVDEPVLKDVANRVRGVHLFLEDLALEGVFALSDL